MASDPISKPRPAAAWAVAMRPASLPIAIGPVLVGAAMGFLRKGSIPLTLAGMALLGALLMQVLTNLQNDIGFTARGSAKVGERVGLPRATANGWLSLRAVRAAIVLLCLVALGLGVGMYVLRGWPVLAMGAASMLAALAYMGGPRPIAYTPFGELTVFVFFGLVAVLGTDWLLTDQLSLASALAASAIGCLSAAALGVNNHRDMEHDQLVGRRTFAICFGARGSTALLGLLLLAPFVLTLGIVWALSAPWFVLPLVLLPTALQWLRDFRSCPGGRAYNALLFRVFRLELWFALALCVAALLTRL